MKNYVVGLLVSVSSLVSAQANEFCFVAPTLRSENASLPQEISIREVAMIVKPFSTELSVEGRTQNGVYPATKESESADGFVVSARLAQKSVEIYEGTVDSTVTLIVKSKRDGTITEIVGVKAEVATHQMHRGSKYEQAQYSRRACGGSDGDAGGQ